MDKFLTIRSEQGEWQQTIKKSQFIVNFMRIDDELAAKNFINQICKEHYKATHNVFAYVIGDNDEIKRYSDNGEPSGTAGIPILEVLQRRQVHNVAAVVTRYFGGIKLGAGGLIRAYAGTVAQGLNALGLVERIFQLEVILTIDYKNADALTYWIKQNQYHMLDTTFDTAVHITIAIDEQKINAVEQTLKDKFSGNILFQIGQPTYLELPVQ
ncbi:YigZ family protein [Convivina praedatoris]|uniref:IMPACT family member YigZ n=1 Tax=Convivina praedatoris TaxID=2880963 RepID=A0ABN8HB40_9LACO|nr:YigZ family protein [Convivina sp. LMG 32447]CAH1856669.1 IMPACT family member YigZ [Convivina sp. LMG 32447]CAH1857066.1 IMPACT family member YigZ [Convivina sp. LMG 32447]CAH1857285.1 IMPACT family member YigZ [Convivina sp. LMG 32447]